MICISCKNNYEPEKTSLSLSNSEDNLCEDCQDDIDYKDLEDQLEALLKL